MENYVKNMRSGVINPINASTVWEAKLEALKQATYFGGGLELYFNRNYYYADLDTWTDEHGSKCFRWVWED